MNITKEEFDNFLKMQDRILDLIEEKTKELSLIMYDSLPEGKICWVDICESELEKDCIFVEFEEYKHGESWKDQFNLPIRFLWDEDYPTIFKREIDEKNKSIEFKKKIDEVARKIVEEVKLESFDRSEYERLKYKYA